MKRVNVCNLSLKGGIVSFKAWQNLSFKKIVSRFYNTFPGEIFLVFHYKNLLTYYQVLFEKSKSFVVDTISIFARNALTMNSVSKRII